MLCEGLAPRTRDGPVSDSGLAVRAPGGTNLGMGNGTNAGLVSEVLPSLATFCLLLHPAPD
jgi:hypothetical protein